VADDFAVEINIGLGHDRDAGELSREICHKPHVISAPAPRRKPKLAGTYLGTTVPPQNQRGKIPMKTDAHIRLFVASCESGPEAWTHQRDTLLQAAARNKNVAIAETPDEADLIFVTDLREDNRYQKLRDHSLVRKYPGKAFAYSDVDEPPRFVRGIFTSLTRSVFNAGRFQSGAYTLFHPDFRNSYIEIWHRTGLPPHEKKHLFSFMGRKCNALRASLLGMSFKHADILIRDTSDFNNFTHSSADKETHKRAYAQALIESKFALCPRGNGASSNRLFEAMQLGIAPVIISDEWVLPDGPDWEKCSIQVSTRDLHRLEDILSAREPEWQQLGANARQAYEEHFDDVKYVDYLVRAARKIQKRSVLPERWVQRAFPAMLFFDKAKRRILRR
jgi:hypothetical protein